MQSGVDLCKTQCGYSHTNSVQIFFLFYFYSNPSSNKKLWKDWCLFVRWHLTWKWEVVSHHGKIFFDSQIKEDHWFYYSVHALYLFQLCLQPHSLSSILPLTSHANHHPPWNYNPFSSSSCYSSKKYPEN